MNDQTIANTSSAGEPTKAKCQMCKFVLIFALVAFFLTLIVTVLLHREGGALLSESSTVTTPA